MYEVLHIQGVFAVTSDARLTSWYGRETDSHSSGVFGALSTCYDQCFAMVFPSLQRIYLHTFEFFESERISSRKSVSSKLPSRAGIPRY